MSEQPISDTIIDTREYAGNAALIAWLESNGLDPNTIAKDYCVIVRDSDGHQLLYREFVRNDEGQRYTSPAEGGRYAKSEWIGRRVTAPPSREVLAMTHVQYDAHLAAQATTESN